MLQDYNKFISSIPKNPFFLFNQKALEKNVSFFLKSFPGKVLYAVKANPSEFILKIIYQMGLDSFDAASLNEIKTIRNLFSKSKIYFMNPVKSENSISQAYYKYNIRHFCLDDENELLKILNATNNANDLRLHLRISIPNNFSLINLSDKFGVNKENASDLIKKIKKKSLKTGISFHPGSQCMNPKAYKIGIKLVSNIVKVSGIKIDYVNVGGGFPSKYPNLPSLSLKEYFKTIKNELGNCCLDKNITLLSEPGRAIVSDCLSYIVKVELRKNFKLYINDGIYGSLRDLNKKKIQHSVKLINRKIRNEKLIPFTFYGPTCDSKDLIESKFYLPESTNEGDYIEIGQMGAYSFTMHSNFNGYFNKPEFFKLQKKFGYKDFLFSVT